MPDLILKATGKPVYVADDAIGDAIASGLYEAPAAGQKVAVEVRPGLVGETDVANLGAVEAQGATVESDASFRGRERKARVDREHGGVLDKAITFGENVLNEASLGGFGIIADAIGGEEYREGRLGRSEANPVTAGVAKVTGAVGTAIGTGGAGIVGKVARATPLGAATRVAGKIAKAGEGASKLAKGARIVGAGAFEGGAQGFGTGVQQLTDSDDPLTIERVSSVLGSNVLLGGAIGGGANIVAKGAEIALTSAKRALDRAATSAATKGVDDFADLASLDAKGLRQAREVELQAIGAQRTTQSRELADEISAFRQEVKDQKLWLATKGAKTWEGVDAALKKEVSEIGKVSLEADKIIDRVLRNPKSLATKPQRALDALQQQEAALERLIARSDDLKKTAFAADKTAERITALDAAASALERNKALQAKIGEVVAAPSSARLAAIDDAKDALVTGTARKGLGEQMAGGAAYSGAAGLVSAVPIVGPILAPFAGAAAARAVSEKLFGAVANGAAKTAERMSKGIGALLDVTKKVAPAAPVLATKVLGSVAFSDKKSKKGTDEKLPELYRKRSEEIRSQVATGPDGQLMMRPDARARVADRLAPIAAVAPVLADRVETQKARATVYLAGILPKRPELGGIQTGPDRWQPSDFAMRSWARSVAAVEDPAGIIERLAAGTVTPEDAEVMRHVYPEMLADITRQILEQLPKLQRTLPYERRLSMSIFTGAPVDPSMRPEVLAVLQGTFAREAGTDGGVHGPMPQPQFGSVRDQDATASQQREGKQL